MIKYIFSIGVVATLVGLIACTKAKVPVSYNQPYTLKTWLALGDSYTIGQSVLETERFASQTIQVLKPQDILIYKPEYIAVTGWTTGNLLTGLQNYTPPLPKYDIVTLLIGVNNQYQGRSYAEYTTQFTTLLTKAIGYAGSIKNHVTVLSIPDWSCTPFANGQNKMQIAKEIDSFNSINNTIALQMGVQYINITPSTRQATTNTALVANDGLHPSGLEYAKWATLLAASIKANL